MLEPLNHPPPASAAGLERVSEAARRLGITPDVLLSSIESGIAPMHVVRLGKRPLMFVNRAETDRFAQQLAQGGVR